MAISRKRKPTPQLTFSLEALHASPSLSPVSEEDFAIRAVTWPSNFLNWLNDAAPGGFFLRTSPACCHRTAEGILEPSSKQWSNAGMGSPTESWTLSLVDWHSGASVCGLSDILETGDHLQRYCLSPRACKGILRRAERRGKKLPEQLEEVLQSVAGVTIPGIHTDYGGSGSASSS